MNANREAIRRCYQRAQALAPNDLRARDASEYGTAGCLYNELLHQLPDHPVIRRNA